MTQNTRDMIREFNLAFGRPVNESWTDLTVTEHELLGKLLLEETLEYVTKGLGLHITYAPLNNGATLVTNNIEKFGVQLNEGDTLDRVACIDGLADVNVVAHFCAHWHGFNLDKATEIVNDSNMSKLGPDGKAIINGVTPGYRNNFVREVGHVSGRVETFAPIDEPGFDPSKPIGKILKGPNFYEPTAGIIDLIRYGDNR